MNQPSQNPDLNLTATPPKKPVSTCLIVFLILLGLFIIGGVLIYWQFWGFTAKDKYGKCYKSCAGLMLRTEDIPMCEMKCSEMYKYEPSPTPTAKTSAKTTSKTSISPSASTSINPTLEYSCNYVWPQEIIEKVSQKLIYACPAAMPWCSPVDNKYENISCCTTLEADQKTKTGCTTLPNLLNQ